jgi:drug/metabolite transporter (DMT)-like permease
MSATSSWASGLGFSVIASLTGAGSKLCIRRSYTLLEELASSSSSSSSSSSPKDDMNYDAVPRTSSVELLKCHTPDTVSEEEEEDEETFQQNDDCWERMPTTQHHQQLTATKTNTVAPSVFQKVEAFSLRALGMFGMMFVGPACNIYALQFASPSILSPVGGGLTLVWIILLSECTIGERPRPIQILAVGLIVMGEIIVALTGDHVNLYSLNVDTMQEQYREPRFLVYFGAMSVWMTFLVIVIRCSNVPVWRRFAWGVMGGSVTGMQNFIKDALAVVHGLDFGNTTTTTTSIIIKEFTVHSLLEIPWSLYGLLLMAAIMPMAGLGLLMACMKRYDATYSASMFMGSLVISASVMSAVHYHTFDHLSTLQSVLYPLGLMTMLSGTAILATETTTRLPPMKTTTTPASGDDETTQKLLPRCEKSQESKSIGEYGAIEMA